MKNALLFFIICFLSGSVFAAEGATEAAAGTDESAGSLESRMTEAKSGCMTPQCLGTEDSLGSPDLEIAELCRHTLKIPLKKSSLF